MPLTVTILHPHKVESSFLNFLLVFVLRGENIFLFISLCFIVLFFYFWPEGFRNVIKIWICEEEYTTSSRTGKEVSERRKGECTGQDWSLKSSQDLSLYVGRGVGGMFAVAREECWTKSRLAAGRQFAWCGNAFECFYFLLRVWENRGVKCRQELNLSSSSRPRTPLPPSFSPRPTPATPASYIYHLLPHHEDVLSWVRKQSAVYELYFLTHSQPPSIFRLQSNF